jgi:UDP-glucose-4-epimerase GalE
VTYDNLSRGNRWAVKWGPLVEGDICDVERLEEVMRTHRIEAVMHFAALAYVGESVTAPSAYYETNVVGSLRLLEAMRRAGVNKIVFSSTCAVYGDPSQVPIEEGEATTPVNPYGRSKAAVEGILRDYQAAYGVNAVILRYFNAAGADPDGEIGEWHVPETHAVPLMLETALGARESFQVFGDDYDTADGTCVRDFIHVCDLAEAHLRALHHLDDAPGIRVYNLGTGSGASLRELITTVERVTGAAVPTKIASRRLGDVPVLVSSYARAWDELGWRPISSDLATIIKTAWDWRRLHLPKVMGDATEAVPSAAQRD